jgi:outer membrane protein assembly factor BamB
LTSSLDAQSGRTSDWWSQAGDAQRTGWEKQDQTFTKADVKDFRLLWKMKLAGKASAPGSLRPPLIIGNLIGSRGFKELAIAAGGTDNLWVIDADLARMYWTRNFGKAAAGTCAAAMAPTPSLAAPITFRFPTAGAPRPVTAPPVNIAQEIAASAALRRLIEHRPIFMLSSDGALHRLNVDNGAELDPAVPFLPAGARARSLNVGQNVVYTTTTKGCSEAPDAVWGITLKQPAAQISSFTSEGSQLIGFGGPVVGTDGTVYVQTSGGALDPAANKYGNALVALTAHELKLKGYFAFDATKSAANSAAPIAFAYKGREMVVAAGGDSSLYLLDASALGGSDHRTPLAKAPALAGKKGVVWGGLSTWEERGGARYILAAVWGPLAGALHAPRVNGKVKHGSIVVFRLEDKDGKPAFSLAWVSPDMPSPAPPVIAQGVVFALSNGEFTKGKAKRAAHATLYALDALTGAQLYSTANEVEGPGSLTGVSIANGRVYFSTMDNTLYAFGKYLETEK